MKFILLVTLLFLVACNPGGAEQEATVDEKEVTERNYYGVWTSDDGNSRLVLHVNGSATLYGVCDFKFTSYKVEFDDVAQGYIRLTGLKDQPTGDDEVCARYVTGPGVNIHMGAELLSYRCMAIDYDGPRNRFCRDDSLQEWRE